MSARSAVQTLAARRSPSVAVRLLSFPPLEPPAELDTDAVPDPPPHFDPARLMRDVDLLIRHRPTRRAVPPQRTPRHPRRPSPPPTVPLPPGHRAPSRVDTTGRSAHPSAGQASTRPSGPADGPTAAGPAIPDGDRPAPGRRPGTVGGEVRPAVVMLVRLCVEVLNGFRTAGQLRGLAAAGRGEAITEELGSAARWLAERSPCGRTRAGTCREQFQPRRVRLAQPHPDAAEITAILHSGHRVVAMPLRIERHDGGWRCTELRVITPGRSGQDDEQ